MSAKKAISVKGKSAAHSRLEAKTAKVATELERALGVPVQKRKLPTPLEMLIATILSQNTNDKNSHKAYLALRRRYRSWSSIARASRQDIVDTIRSGGMANQKAGQIQNALAEVMSRFGRYSLSRIHSWSNGKVIDILTSINGIGIKTASCVLLFSMRRDVFPVDTHVHRMCGRLGLTLHAKSPEQTFYQMKDLVPKGKGYSFHTNLIRFGRRICRTHLPNCGSCPFFKICLYEGKTTRKGAFISDREADHDFMLLDHVETKE